MRILRQKTQYNFYHETQRNFADVRPLPDNLSRSRNGQPIWQGCPLLCGDRLD